MKHTITFLRWGGIFLLPFGFLLASCATSINSNKLTEQAKADQVAIVTGQASSFFSEYDMASTEFDVHILSVNGIETHSAWYGHAIKVSVHPGKARLDVSCSYTGSYTSNAVFTFVLKPVLKAGHVYRLAPSLNKKYDCIVKLRDVTSH